MAAITDKQKTNRSTGIRAARAVCRDMAVSDTTLWRWEKWGRIRTVNISGKKFVDLASLAEFERRAAAGEFAKGPHGAARKAAARAKANVERLRDDEHPLAGNDRQAGESPMLLVTSLKAQPPNQP